MVFYYKTASHRQFQSNILHHGSAEDWCKCEIDSAFLLRMTQYMATRLSMQTSFHPLTK